MQANSTYQSDAEVVKKANQNPEKTAVRDRRDPPYFANQIKTCTRASWDICKSPPWMMPARISQLVGKTQCIMVHPPITGYLVLIKIH